ncbi:hypothetical protein OROHE_023442 [Orobanche hederae]
MATKSDFAQKLLHDLRVRKERMAAAQNSSRQSTQTSRVEHGNSGQTSRGSRQINALESAGPRAGNTSRASNNGNNKPINTKESSNQIILYGNGQSSIQQTRNRSMAIAFAFGNNGNLSKITTSTTNPLVSFFNRFGRKSRDTHKMDITSFDNRDEPTGQFPRVSSIHITEVSKGVQKLNQILRACSDGFSFESNSVEVGKELLKGAVDLEESLRMLVRFQETSQYSNTTRKKKSQLKLLEEDEDDQEDDAKAAKQLKLDRPKFSFDKPSRNSRVVQYATKQEDLCLSTQVKQNNNNNSSSSESMQGKRRISNVVAKLMGLEEIHQNEDFILKKNDSTGKQVKVSKQINQVNVHHQIFEDKQRKQNPTSGKQRKSIENERKMKISNNEQQQKAENHKTTNSRNSIETRKADKEPPRNQQKHEEKRVLLLIQEHVLKRGESTKNKHWVDKSRASRQVESITPPKPKKSKAVEKKPTLGNGKYTKQTEKVSTKDTLKILHQDVAPAVIGISPQMAPNKEDIKKEDQIPDSSKRGPQLDTDNKNRNPAVITHENPIEVSAKRKASTFKKVQRSEIPRKIDVLMTRKGATTNRLTRTIKHPAKLLKDLKQQMHNKNRISKETDEQGDRKVNEAEAGISAKQQEKVQNEDNQSIISNTSTTHEYQIQNIQKTRTRTPNDGSDAKALNPISGRVSGDPQTVEQHYAPKVEQELKKFDQNAGDPEEEEESTELYNLPRQKDEQIQAPERQKQLTEPEKELKEIVIKSQMFLSTAVALFKLDIPVTFLHAAEQDYEAAEKNKLVLNCAYEVMKRKARRHKNTYNLYTKTSTSRTKLRSLDDLIKQVCRDLETIKCYGDGNGSDECDVASRLYEMHEKDIHNKDPNVNSMWDFEWSDIMSSIPEKEDIVRDVERYMINGLLDEITKDLVVVLLTV